MRCHASALEPHFQKWSVVVRCHASVLRITFPKMECGCEMSYKCHKNNVSINGVWM